MTRREIQQVATEFVFMALTIVSWLALALAALAMITVLVGPPPTKSKDPDLSGGYTLNGLIGIGMLLMVSVATRLVSPSGDRRFERNLYWVIFGLVALVWMLSVWLEDWRHSQFLE